MRRKDSLSFITGLLGVIGFLVAASAQEDCPRGTLDKAYCDRNGDWWPTPRRIPKK